MKYLAILLCLCSAPLALAAEPTPSDESIRQLLDVTQARRLLDGMTPQIEAAMKQEIRRTLGNKVPNEQQQAILNDMQSKLLAVVQGELRWDLLEPQLITLYKEAFTQEEVEGILQFYRSSVGQAMVNKMPLVMQGSMRMMQSQMQRIGPKVKAIEQDAIRQMKECCSEAGAN